MAYCGPNLRSIYGAPAPTCTNNGSSSTDSISNYTNVTPYFYTYTSNTVGTINGYSFVD